MKKVCIVGYGGIGPVHSSVLNTIRERVDCKVIFYGVCDNKPERLDKARDDYPFLKTYLSYDDVVADNEIDSVHICTPHYLHYEMIKKALDAGKSVLCEKPVTITAKEFESLRQNENTNKLGIVFQNRYTKSITKLAEITKTQKYGRLKGIKGIVTWSRKNNYYMDEWHGRKACEGGSALINQSIHTLDIMCMLGGTVEGVRAKSANFCLDGIIETEDFLMSSIKYKNGVGGVLFCTTGYERDAFPEVEVVFENAVVTFTDNKLLVNGEVVCTDETGTGKKAYWGTGHMAAISEFYRDGGKKIGINDVANTMNTLFSIYESCDKCGEEMLIK